MIVVIFSLISPIVESINDVQGGSQLPPTIWIAFFHGLGGNATSNVPLINELNRQFNNAGITLKFINPQLPNDVNLNTWSQNIAVTLKDWIENNSQSNPRIITIGHSMGGKAVLHAAALDEQGIFDRVESIITINSPIKNLGQYRPFTYMWNGVLLSLLAEQYLHSLNTKSIMDIRDKDTSMDAKHWVVDEQKEWMAFISAECYPSDPQYDLTTSYGTVDLFPREMDDGLVPINAQYTEHAITEYYGSCNHQGMINNQTVINTLSTKIVHYCSGESINVSKLYKTGQQTHITILPKKWIDVAEDTKESADSKLENLTSIQLKNKLNLGPVSNSLPNTSIVRDHYEVSILDKSTIRRNGIEPIHWENNNLKNINLIINSWAWCGFITYKWSIFIKEKQQFKKLIS